VDRRVAIVFALVVVATVIFDATQSAFWWRCGAERKNGDRAREEAIASHLAMIAGAP
jgi:hypothetical protein